MLHIISEYQKNIIKSFDKSDNILVWDDCYIHQYEYIKELQEFNNILAVPSNIITASSNQESHSCLINDQKEIFDQYFLYNDASNFMTWDMVLDLYHNYNVKIAAHSFNHNKVDNNIKEFLVDIQNMKQQFLHYMNYIPDIYVYPYNYENNVSNSLLKSQGFHTIYGKNRIDINQQYPNP